MTVRVSWRIRPAPRSFLFVLTGWNTPISTRLKDRVVQQFAPKVRMSVLPPRRLSINPALVGRDRRRAAGLQLYDMMAETLFTTTDIDKTLFRSLVEASALNGRRHRIVEDTNFTPLTYGRLIAAALVLGRKLKGRTETGEITGILLPNSVAAVVAFFALQAFGRVPPC